MSKFFMDAVIEVWKPELPFEAEQLEFVQWHVLEEEKMLYIEIALVDLFHGKKLADTTSEEERKDWCVTRDHIGYKMLKALEQMPPLEPHKQYGSAFSNRPEIGFRFGVFGNSRCYIYLPRLHLEQ